LYVKVLAAKIFFRSFMVQSSWNFERMQNLGFYFMIYPALEARYGSSRERFRQKQLSHLEYFNSHPYLAGLAAGTVAAVDEDGLGGAASPAGLKRALMSSLGSLGDRLFWTALRPFAAVAALVPALAGRWWAPLVLLALYNVPHFTVRWRGVSSGLRLGWKVCDSLQSIAFSEAVPVLGAALVVLSGVSAGVLTGHPDFSLVQGSTVLSFCVAAAVFAPLRFLFQRGVSMGKVFMCLIGVVSLGGLLREVIGL
jgi:PTS system mannose-specific IID component